MGWFSSKKNDDTFWADEAEKQGRTAKDEAAKAKTYRTRQSGDPEADRYMARQHEENRRLAEANARDARARAGKPKGWL